MSIIFDCKTDMFRAWIDASRNLKLNVNHFHTHKITFWIHHIYHPRQRREKLFDGIIQRLESVTYAWSVVSLCLSVKWKSLLYMIEPCVYLFWCSMIMPFWWTIMVCNDNILIAVSNISQVYIVHILAAKGSNRRSKHTQNQSLGR